METVNLLSHRPLPAGHDVHVYDFENGGRGLVLLVLAGEVSSQTSHPTYDAARLEARRLADHHQCSMIEHFPYASRGNA